MCNNFSPEVERLSKMLDGAEAALNVISGQFDKGACHDDYCEAAIVEWNKLKASLVKTDNGDPVRLENFINEMTTQAVAQYMAHGGDYRPTAEDPAGKAPDESYESKARYYITVLLSTEREGIDELIKYMVLKTDFFTAPASAMYHSNYCGGLLDHTINVYMRLNDTYYSETSRNGRELSESQRKSIDASIAIAALLHDLCKANFYKWGKRNVKDDATGQWKQVPWISYDEQIPFGNHGDKSVFLAERFIRLTMPEAFAIRFHMGEYDKDKNTSAAFTRYPLAFLLHRADETATYIDENLALQGISVG